MNKYIKDSFFFLRTTSRSISKRMNDEKVIHATLNLALGLERILKGILFDINPLYILLNPEFKNSVQCFYSKSIIDKKQLAKAVDEDVITYRKSLLRSQVFSKCCTDYTNVLFKISDARDIIVHHELNRLDIKSLREILIRDYYPMMKAFVDELKIPKNKIFDGVHIKLSTLSSSLQSDLESKISLMLETHREKWKMLKNNPGFIEKRQLVTSNVLRDINNEECFCPSCENPAVLYLSPIFEFSPVDGERYQIGSEVIKLKCQFCKLETDEPSVLDKFYIRPRLMIRKKQCSRCSKKISNGNSTGFCDDCETYYGTEN